MGTQPAPEVRFKDYFSQLAPDYQHYRPTYPETLFEFLANLTARYRRAWDCATGNGQAALGLARYFDLVVATDGSRHQLARATRRAKIVYPQAPAEYAPFVSRCFDLIVVTQAVHWFELEAFYADFRRVATPQCLLALCGYHLPKTSPEIDALIHHLAYDIVNAYWPRERLYIDARYRNLPFPFAEIGSPTFSMQQDGTLS